MNFSSNKLPSSSAELEWYWKHFVSEPGRFSQIPIGGIQTNFRKPMDYFHMPTKLADQISIIGSRFNFFDVPISLNEFELNVFGDIGKDTQIGSILQRISRMRETAEVYGLYASFIYRNKAVYCAFTICYVDKDFGQEMETAIVEISEDESAFVQPVFISEEALDYYSFDDITELAYWLGNFWMGAQYELNNPPEETRIVERHGPISEGDIKRQSTKRIILVKRVIPLDKDGNIIEYGPANSGKNFTCPKWPVRGHYRHYQNGKVIYIDPYPKGRERNNPDIVVEREYRFVEEKINADE